MNPFFIKKLTNGSILGLFEMTISTEEMLESLNWEPQKLIEFHKLKSEKKKKEWLGVRLLLKKMLKDQGFTLQHDDHGKPILKDSNDHISISHSGKFVCVLINREISVGVDVQGFKPNIEKGTGLFMSDQELHESGWKLDAKILHIYWGAKEAIYKLIGSKETNIKTDIYIFPFDLRNFGSLKGETKDGKRVDLNYELSDEYVLVYSV